MTSVIINVDMNSQTLRETCAPIDDSKRVTHFSLCMLYILYSIHSVQTWLKNGEMQANDCVCGKCRGLSTFKVDKPVMF